MLVCFVSVGYPGIFFEGGGGRVTTGNFLGWVQQIQLRTEGRENGDLGVTVRGSTQSANE
jgi:hypothetical protein